MAAMTPIKTQKRVPHTLESLTANEAAEHLKIKPRTLLLWAKQGKVKGYNLSGTKRYVWRFLRRDSDSALLGDRHYRRE